MGQSPSSEIDALAQHVWNYLKLHHALRPADIILALGSNDLRVAENAANLYLNGLAPLLMFSGNVGVLTRETFDQPEAEKFAEIAVQKGVPRSSIIIEAKSTNTGENIQFSRRVLSERGLDPQRLILVQKPYMERRAFATFMKNWPGKDVVVSSPPGDFADYFTEALPKELVINIMVGDLQRIREYPARGFQIEQEIPDDVWRAFELLVQAGFDKHLIK
jgi:uncharacterized SAM-binding protein YcdF (DUF218 family)